MVSPSTALSPTSTFTFADARTRSTTESTLFRSPSNATSRDIPPGGFDHTASIGAGTGSGTGNRPRAGSFHSDRGVDANGDTVGRPAAGPRTSWAEENEKPRERTTNPRPPVKVMADEAVIDLPSKSHIQLFYSISLPDSIFSTEFRMMFLMLFCNGLFGLTTTGKLQDIIKFQFQKDAAEASLINAIFALFSATGRVLIPVVSDWVGRRGVYCLLLFVQAVVCAAFPTVFNNLSYPAFLIGIFALVSCYGAGYGAIPAFLSDMFGARNVGALHGIILCTWSIGGIIGLGYNAILNEQVHEYGKDARNVYNVNFYWILPVIIIGFIDTLFIKTNIRDRVMPRMRNEWFRLRLGSRLIVVTSSGIRTFSREEDDAIWARFLSTHGY